MTASEHQCSTWRLAQELDRANNTIAVAGALRTEADGFRWVDESKLPAAFMEYYAGLCATGYALGAW